MSLISPTRIYYEFTLKGNVTPKSVISDDAALNQYLTKDKVEDVLMVFSHAPVQVQYRIGRLACR